MVTAPKFNGEIGIVGNVNICTPSDVRRVTYLDWCKTVDSFLSLDISVRGTGWVMWKNGELTWGRNSLKEEGEVERRFEFSEWLLNLIDGYSFEYYFVEDVIQSNNFKTARSLFSLNTVLESLIYEGKVTKPKELFKCSNKVWKKDLKGSIGGNIIVAGTSHTAGNDKECTKACLTELGLDITQIKRGTYTDKQVEDICDALGMAVGTISAKINKVSAAKAKVQRCDIRKGYKIKQFTTKEDAEKSAQRCSKKGEKPIIYIDLVAEGTKDLIQYMRKQIPENPTAIFIVYVGVNQCCNLMLLKNLDVSLDKYFLTITK